MRNTFIQDCAKPLDEIQRVWIRIPITLLLITPVLIMGILAGIIDGVLIAFKDFITPCLKGPKD